MNERFLSELKSTFKQKDSGSNDKYALLLQELGQYIGSKDLATQAKLLDEVVASVNNSNVWGKGERYEVAKLGYEIKPTFVIQEEFCINCGKSIPRKKGGRPSKFCSVRCRVAHFRKGKTVSNETIDKSVTDSENTPKKRKAKDNVSSVKDTPKKRKAKDNVSNESNPKLGI